MSNRILILLTATLFSMIALSDTNLTVLKNSVSPKLAVATLLNHADPNQKLNLLVWLKGRNPDGLQQFLTALYTPGNPQYHRFLTPEQFQADYAPDPDNISVVTGYLTEQGINVVKVPSNGAFIQISTTVAQAEAAFNVHINKYSLNGKQYYSNDQVVTLNSDLASMISAISGLDNFLQLQSPHAKMESSKLGTAQAQYGSYTPQQIQAAYGVDQLLKNNVNGSNQVVAVIDSLDSPGVESDLNTFSTQFHLPLCTRSNGCFAKFNQYGESFPLPEPAPFGDSSEAPVDIEVVHSLAPGAKLSIYEDNGDDWGTNLNLNNFAIALNTIVSGNLANIISNSLATGEDVVNGPLEIIFQQGAAQGISINFSSADFADNTNNSYGTNSPLPSVVYPASSPWVTAVGGTTLLLTSYNSYKSETGWADPTQSDLGSTGGLSQYYTAQPWQTEAINSIYAGGYGLVGTHRAVPDISMMATPGFIGYSRTYGNGLYATSLSCPLFSAIIALANQARVSQGLSTVGLVTSLLYNMPYSVHQGIAPITSIVAPATTPTSVLTGGSHWNDITGLGSPYAPLFVKYLVDDH